jgi:hypothetical protein
MSALQNSEPEPAAAVVLLQLLAFGQLEIEQGKFRSAEDVFAEFDKQE